MFDWDRFSKDLMLEMRARGASQRDVGRPLGINPSTMCRVTAGQGVSTETTLRLCQWAGRDPFSYLSVKP